jgi:hypothetical protein
MESEPSAGAERILEGGSVDFDERGSCRVIFDAIQQRASRVN